MLGKRGRCGHGQGTPHSPAPVSVQELRADLSPHKSDLSSQFLRAPVVLRSPCSPAPSVSLKGSLFLTPKGIQPGNVHTSRFSLISIHILSVSSSSLFTFLNNNKEIPEEPESMVPCLCSVLVMESEHLGIPGLGLLSQSCRVSAGLAFLRRGAMMT